MSTIIHKSSYLVEEDFLRNVPIPTQERIYKPVSYASILDTIDVVLDKANIPVSNRKFLAAKKGNQATIHYTLGIFDDKEQAVQIVAQNSYDKSMSFKFVMGSSILVCSNSCVRSNRETAFKKKHVGEIQTLAPEKIYEFIYNTAEEFNTYISYRELLKNYDLSKSAVHSLVGKLFLDEQIVNTDQLNILKREIMSPSYNYGTNGNTVWDFYNHVTAALRTSHPSNWVNNHIAFDEFINKELNLN